MIPAKTTLVQNGKVIEGNLSQKHLNYFATVPAGGILKQFSVRFQLNNCIHHIRFYQIWWGIIKRDIALAMHFQYWWKSGRKPLLIIIRECYPCVSFKSVSQHLSFSEFQVYGLIVYIQNMQHFKMLIFYLNAHPVGIKLRAYLFVSANVLELDLSQNWVDTGKFSLSRKIVMTS